MKNSLVLSTLMIAFVSQGCIHKTTSLEKCNKNNADGCVKLAATDRDDKYGTNTNIEFERPSEEELREFYAQGREDFEMLDKGKQAIPLNRGQIDDGIVMFPKADKNEQQFVIKIKTKPNQMYKIELTASIRKMADCNVHMLGGRFFVKSLGGWGYPYYIFQSDERGGASTLMACPFPDTEKLLSATPMVVDYNDKLPLIVYMPTGYELHYRIFTSNKSIKAQ